MKKLLTFLTCLFLLSPNVVWGGAKVSLVCKWTDWNHHYESFVIDLSKKTVLWVNEETELKLEKVTDGYVTFQGKKNSIKIESGWLRDVPISFKIDRISGRFHVDFDEVETVGLCEKKVLF